MTNTTQDKLTGKVIQTMTNELKDFQKLEPES